MIPTKFLMWAGFIANPNGEDTETPNVKEMLEEHLKASISETAVEHIDSDKATKGAQNIETLSKAYSNLEKAESERKRIELQIEEAKRRRMANWDIIIPKVAGVVITGAVTIFWLSMEQGSPLPMRLVQMTNSLTVPRGL